MEYENNQYMFGMKTESGEIKNFTDLNAEEFKEGVKKFSNKLWYEKIKLNQTMQICNDLEAYSSFCSGDVDKKSFLQTMLSIIVETQNNILCIESMIKMFECYEGDENHRIKKIIKTINLPWVKKSFMTSIPPTKDDPEVWIVQFDNNLMIEKKERVFQLITMENMDYVVEINNHVVCLECKMKVKEDVSSDLLMSFLHEDKVGSLIEDHIKKEQSDEVLTLDKKELLNFINSVITTSTQILKKNKDEVNK